MGKISEDYQIAKMDRSERKASTLWSSFRKKTFRFRSPRRWIPEEPEDGSKIVRTIWSLYCLDHSNM